nr:aminoglycoside phosphotransferase family protein [Sporosarcina sp. ACRSL]
MTAILNKFYGIEATFIEQRPGGWSALAYEVQDRNNKYFLKVYNKNKPSVVRWIHAIDIYTPLVKWLHDQTDLKHHIINPILTLSDQNKCEDSEFVYVLSEYIEGVTIGENQLSSDQVNELAKILGILHNNTSMITNELKELQIKETYSTELCDSLFSFIHHDLDQKDDGLLVMVKPYIDSLKENIERIRTLSNKLANKQHNFVLSHSDAHNWNVMQSRNLMLIDWECLKLAPQEQDLILFVTESYAKQFLHEYKKYMNYDTPDFDAFEFYYLKRILEDIWEWINDLRYEGLVKSEDVTLNFLKLNLEACTRTGRFRSELQKVFQ